MPNPPFQPLTLSVEQLENRRLILWTHSFGFAGCRDSVEQVFRHIETQAQAAASLRQRLEEQQNDIELLKGKTVWANDHIEALAGQLAQAQQELADANQQLEVLRPGGLYAWKTKYEQAEAALEEMQKPVVIESLSLALDAIRENARNGRRIGGEEHYLGWERMAGELESILAELQRRRSLTGQEKK